MLRSSVLLVAFALLVSLVQNTAAVHIPRKNEISQVSEDLLHYALHAVHPNFKDGVFASNQQAMEALEQENKELASKVYALAKRQANTTTPVVPITPTPPERTTPIVEPTTPFLTTQTSSFESVVTTNGQRSTFTAVTVIVRTQTPTPPVGQQTTVNPQLQSLGVRTRESSLMLFLLVMGVGFASLWMCFW